MTHDLEHGNGHPEGEVRRRNRVDFRELEARLDARLQAVSARFVRLDNQLSAIDERLSGLERTNSHDPKTVAEIAAAVTAELLHQMSGSRIPRANE